MLVAPAGTVYDVPLVRMTADPENGAAGVTLADADE
jgi:hypothetical protein